MALEKEIEKSLKYGTISSTTIECPDCGEDYVHIKQILMDVNKQHFHFSAYCEHCPMDRTLVMEMDNGNLHIGWSEDRDKTV